MGVERVRELKKAKWGGGKKGVSSYVVIRIITNNNQQDKYKSNGYG
jgi:hypothetical protein